VRHIRTNPGQPPRLVALEMIRERRSRACQLAGGCVASSCSCRAHQGKGQPDSGAYREVPPRFPAVNLLIDFPDVGAAPEFNEPAELHRVHSDRQPAYRYRCDAQEAVNMIAAGREQTGTARKHSVTSGRTRTLVRARIAPNQFPLSLHAAHRASCSAGRRFRESFRSTSPLVMHRTLRVEKCACNHLPRNHGQSQADRPGSCLPCAVHRPRL